MGNLDSSFNMPPHLPPPSPILRRQVAALERMAHQHNMPMIRK